MGRTACTEPQCLYSRAIPLLPLWTVRPVQSLSVCTVELYLYSPYGPYGLYRAPVPVQGCTFPLLFLLQKPKKERSLLILKSEMCLKWNRLAFAFWRPFFLHSFVISFHTCKRDFFPLQKTPVVGSSLIFPLLLVRYNSEFLQEWSNSKAFWG